MGVIQPISDRRGLAFLEGAPVSLFAPAKLNLRLKVLDRRSDGYHLLSMLNATLGFGDDIEISVAKEGKFRVSIKGEALTSKQVTELESASHNLAAMAAQSFLERFRGEHGLEIKIHKRIPVGAGLGGGSSDAAAVLRFLACAFYEQDRGRHENYIGEIEAMALKLGADVPYLLHGGLAYVRGIGEIVTLLPEQSLTDRQCLLITFPFGCSTREVFRLYDSFAEGGHSSVDEPLEAFSAKGVSTGANFGSPQFSSLIENDLECAACQAAPPILEILKGLRRNLEVRAGITGSGSAVFALSSDGGAFRKGFYDEAVKLAGRAQGTAILTSFQHRVDEFSRV